MAWVETLTKEQIAHLDKALEPKLTEEEEAAVVAAKAEMERERFEREWESWGTSPEQLASQQRAMAMAGGEG